MQSLWALTMCSRVLLSLRDPTMPTSETVNITRPSRMSTTAGARKSPSRVRFFCLSTSAYTPTHSTQRPTSYRQQRPSQIRTFKNFSVMVTKLSLGNYVFGKFSNFTGVSVLIYKDHISRRKCETSNDCVALESAAFEKWQRIEG